MDMERKETWRLAPCVAGAALAAALLAASPAGAQTAWKPERAVEFITGTSGSAAERTGRTAMMMMQEKGLLPVPAAMMAKVGAGNSIAFNYLGTKAGDGHYVLISTMALSTNFLTGVGTLGFRDFTTVAMLIDEYVAVIVRADSPVKDGRDLVARLRKDPASLSYGISSALGSATHLGPTVVFKAAGVEVKRIRTVVFDSAGKSVTAVLGGHVDFASASLSSVAAQADAGTVRILGITAPARVAGRFASVPTWKEMGADGWFSSYRGVTGARGLNEAQVAFWENAFAAVDADPRWQQDAEKNLVNRQFRRSQEARKYLEDLDAQLRPLLADLGMLKQ